MQRVLRPVSRLASEYEKNHGMTTLQPFFDSSIPNIRHPEVQQWGQDLLSERSERQGNTPVNEVSGR